MDVKQRGIVEPMGFGIGCDCHCDEPQTACINVGACS